MSRYRHKMRLSLLLLSNGLYLEFLKTVWGRLFGRFIYFGLTMEIDSYDSAALSRMALVARPIEEEDYPLLSAILSDRTIRGHERQTAAFLLTTLRTNLKTCYVVEDVERNVRFLQWLILAAENENRRLVYPDWYPSLSPDEAMMESVYVFPKYRGTGILAYGVKKILDIASVSGIKRIVIAIPSRNANSLTSFIKLGFKPYLIRIENRFFGRRRAKTFHLTSSMDERALRMTLPPSIVRKLLNMKAITLLLEQKPPEGGVSC